MNKKVLLIGLCVGSVMINTACAKEEKKDNTVKVPTVQEETVATPGKVETPSADKIYSAEQKDIYEQYEGYSIKKMYASMSSDVGMNIRKGPTENHQRVDGLEANKVINVIGQCKETGWYMILYSGGVGFVSDDYLNDTVDNGTLVLGEECPYSLYVKTEYKGEVGWFYRPEVGWQCQDYDRVMDEIVAAGYGVEHFPVYVGNWRDVGNVMWIGYTKE